MHSLLVTVERADLPQGCSPCSQLQSSTGLAAAMLLTPAKDTQKDVLHVQLSSTACHHDVTAERADLLQQRSQRSTCQPVSCGPALCIVGLPPVMVLRMTESHQQDTGHSLLHQRCYCWQYSPVISSTRMQPMLQMSASKLQPSPRMTSGAR